MNSQGDGSKFGRAIAIAPLAAPLAVAVGSTIRSLLSPPAAPSGINPIAAAVFGVVLLSLYGAPLAYGCTVCILWPAAAVLRDTRAYRCWVMALVGGAGGAILFPLYLQALDPRGTWDFFPGAGFVAGAATGCAFWYIAARD
jgi:hypothetical protein